MTLPNTIGLTQAQMRDGSVISYRDADPTHVRQERIRLIFDSDPLHFTVTEQDGSSFSVDLLSGELLAGIECYKPENLTTPLRLIYYKHMEMSSGSETAKPEMVYYVLGWQTTTAEGHNAKLGLKVFPGQRRYEVTTEI